MTAATKCALGGCAACRRNEADEQARITPEMIREAGSTGRYGFSWGGVVEAFGRAPTTEERAHLADFRGPGVRSGLEEFLDPRQFLTGWPQDGTLRALCGSCGKWHKFRAPGAWMHAPGTVIGRAVGLNCAKPSIWPAGQYLRIAGAV